MATNPATAPETAPSTLGLPFANPLRAGPTHRGGRRRKVRGYKSAGSQTVRSQRAAGIKAEPAHPQQAGADEAQDDTVRRHLFVGISQALAQVKSTHQGGNAAGDMHHRPSREVERRENTAQGGVQKAALSPHHVGHRRIDQNGPEHCEKHHGAEFHALGKAYRGGMGRNGVWYSGALTIAPRTKYPSINKSIVSAVNDLNISPKPLALTFVEIATASEMLCARKSVPSTSMAAPE